MLTIRQDNPKLAGSKSYFRYEQYKHAKTVTQFLEMGGTAPDLKHDVSKGFITYEGELPVLAAVPSSKPAPKRVKRVGVESLICCNLC